MAGATNTHDYPKLSCLSRWHVESDAIDRALAMVIKAQSALPPLGTLLRNTLPGNAWLGSGGAGVTAYSDGSIPTKERKVPQDYA
ncbi:MAG: hypothetical protein ACI9ND_000478 [Yoonia sp.]|jgi:hypothetical protein